MVFGELNCGEHPGIDLVSALASAHSQRNAFFNFGSQVSRSVFGVVEHGLKSISGLKIGLNVGLDPVNIEMSPVLNKDD